LKIEESRNSYVIKMTEEKKASTLVGFAQYESPEDAIKNPEPLEAPWKEFTKHILQGAYTEIVVDKEPEEDFVPDPFWDEEATGILEKITETQDRRPVSFEQTWEFSKSALEQGLKDKTYTDMMFQMLKMAEGQAQVPEDFQETFNAYMEKFVAEISQDIVMYENFMHAWQGLEAIRPYVNSTNIVDVKTFERLCTLYSKELKDYRQEQ